MLKPIFDEDVDFFSKIIILCAKGGDCKKGALDSDFIFVNIEPYKSKKCGYFFVVSPRQKIFNFFDLKFDRRYYFNLDAFLNSIADIILTWMRSYTKMLINLS